MNFEDLFSVSGKVVCVTGGGGGIGRGIARTFVSGGAKVYSRIEGAIFLMWPPKFRKRVRRVFGAVRGHDQRRIHKKLVSNLQELEVS